MTGRSPSLHLFGLAYDGEPDPKTDATWQTYGETAEALGLQWGGRWTRRLPGGKVISDRPHVQLPRSSSVAKAALSAGVLVLVVLGAARLLRPLAERAVS